MDKLKLWSDDNPFDPFTEDFIDGRIYNLYEDIGCLKEDIIDLEARNSRLLTIYHNQRLSGYDLIDRIKKLESTLKEYRG